MSLETVTARLPHEVLKEIERLARKEKVDRSELIRRLLDFALRQRRIEDALQAYREGRVTLWRAAEIACISLREMMELAQQVEKALAATYHPEGYNLGMNLGRSAGAGVADHVHLHFLPRWTGDTGFMTAVSETRVHPEDLAASYAKLAPFFAR